MVGCQIISLDHLTLRVEKPEDGDSRFLQIVGAYLL